jgi:hypothetical protein
MGLVVPAAAVDARGTAPTVTRIKGGKAERVQVQIGLTDKSSETTEILSGLQAGDTLLLGAAQGITPGTPVKVTAPLTPAATSMTPTTTAAGGGGL